MDNRREQLGKLTDTSTDVFYGIGLPHSLFECFESELGEYKVSHKAVNLGLQKYPRRLRLNTVEKRISAIRGIENQCEPFSEKMEDL
jgi:hypothetical protein